jgi:hypothetical protein
LSCRALSCRLVLSILALSCRLVSSSLALAWRALSRMFVRSLLLIDLPSSCLVTRPSNELHYVPTWALYGERWIQKIGPADGPAWAHKKRLGAVRFPIWVVISCCRQSTQRHVLQWFYGVVACASVLGSRKANLLPLRWRRCFPSRVWRVGLWSTHWLAAQAFASA